MEHFKEEVLLSETEDGTYQLVFKGVSYRPTDNPTVAGVLLFGLRPKGINAYFSPSWTAFQAERGRDFSVIVDGISN